MNGRFLREGREAVSAFNSGFPRSPRSSMADLNNKITRKTYYRPRGRATGPLATMSCESIVATRLHSKRNRSSPFRRPITISILVDPAAILNLSIPRNRRIEKHARCSNSGNRVACSIPFACWFLGISKEHGRLS